MGDAALDRAKLSSGYPKRAGPHRSFTILDGRSKFQSGKIGIVRELAVLPTCEPLIGANPKTPIAPGEQTCNHAAGELLTRRRLPGDGPDAVEAKQAEFRAEPEITVGRLG